MNDRRMPGFLRRSASGSGVRSAILSTAVVFVTFHGQTVDETPSHRAIGNVTLSFCGAVPMRHPDGSLCVRRRMYVVKTDRNGRFTIGNFKPGSYIIAGRSPDVGWFEGPYDLRPSSDAKPTLFYLCSHKTQPRECAPPSSGRDVPL